MMKKVNKKITDEYLNKLMRKYNIVIDANTWGIETLDRNKNYMNDLVIAVPILIEKIRSMQPSED